MMPRSSRVPAKISFSLCSTMQRRAAGMRSSLLQLLLPERDRRMRELARSRTPRARPSVPRRDTAAPRCRVQSKLPRTWHARMRSCSIAGMFDASDSANASSTMRTMCASSGRGSSSSSDDLSAYA